MPHILGQEPKRKEPKWINEFSVWCSEVHKLFRMGKTPAIFTVACDMGEEIPDLMFCAYNECTTANEALNPLAMLMANVILEVTKSTGHKRRDIRKASETLVKQALLVLSRGGDGPNNMGKQCEH